MKPHIQCTEFGSITVADEGLDHDIVIRLNGEGEEAQKKLSRKEYGDSHTVSLEEAEHIFDDGAERLVIGSGQDGNVKLSEEAGALTSRRKAVRSNCIPTQEAIKVWNEAEGKTIAMFHVTC